MAEEQERLTGYQVTAHSILDYWEAALEKATDEPSQKVIRDIKLLVSFLDYGVTMQQFLTDVVITLKKFALGEKER